MSRNCRLFSCLIALLLFVTNFSFAETVTGKPKLTLLESSYDFGTVVDGTKVEHDFSIKNDGDAPLTIQRVVAGCGCTATSLATTAIEPGQTTVIKVAVDTNGFSGPQSKAVRIYSDDPVNPMSTVAMKGIVEPEIKIQPLNVFFENVVRGQSGPHLTKELRIKFKDKSAQSAASLQSFSKFIQIKELAGTETEKTYAVTLDANLPVGDFRDRINVTVAGGRNKNINIPVFAAVRGAIKLDPPALSFGVISGKDLIVRKVKLENSAAETFHIRKIESNHEAVTAKIIPIEDGRSYWIEVSVNPLKISNDLRTSLNVLSDGNLAENISLNVYGVLPPKV